MPSFGPDWRSGGTIHILALGHSVFIRLLETSPLGNFITETSSYQSHGNFATVRRRSGKMWEYRYREVLTNKKGSNGVRGHAPPENF